MSIPCTQEGAIKKLQQIVYEGNGQPSIVSRLASMEEKIDGYMGRQEDLIKEFGLTSREFSEFKTKVTTIEEEKEKSDNRRRWRTGAMVTVTCVLLTIFSAWMLALRGEFKKDRELLTELLILQLDKGQARSVPIKPVEIKPYKPTEAHVDSVIKRLIK
jgi:hypothetical protein